MQPEEEGNTEITFRTAQPTIEDGRIYARYLDKVTEGFVRMRFGPKAHDLVARVFTHPDHDMSYQNVFFVEHKGQIVGMAAGFTARQQRTFSEKALRQEAGGLALRIRITAILFGPMLRILETIEEGDFYIVTMIVDDDLRGQGVGSKVLAHLDQRAREAGAERISLDVAKANKRARRLYERKGWIVQSQWPNFPLIPPVFFRMARPLE